MYVIYVYIHILVEFKQTYTNRTNLYNIWNWDPALSNHLVPLAKLPYGNNTLFAYIFSLMFLPEEPYVDAHLVREFQPTMYLMTLQGITKTKKIDILLSPRSKLTCSSIFWGA